MTTDAERDLALITLERPGGAVHGRRLAVALSTVVCANDDVNEKIKQQTDITLSSSFDHNR